MDTGAVYLLVARGGVFRQAQKLVAGDRTPPDHFGEAVVADGSTVVVGAPNHAAVGAYARACYVSTHGEDSSFRFAQKLVIARPGPGGPSA